MGTLLQGIEGRGGGAAACEEVGGVGTDRDQQCFAEALGDPAIAPQQVLARFDPESGAPGVFAATDSDIAQHHDVEQFDISEGAAISAMARAEAAQHEG